VSGPIGLQDPAALGVAGSCAIHRYDSSMRPLLLVLITLLLAACAPATPPAPAAGTPSPAGSSATPTAALTPVGSAPPSDAEASPPATAETATQTDTEWGRIWDALPAGFPVYPGAIPTETRAGPVTAELAVPTDPITALSWYRTALEAAGYATQAVSDPLEDGSVVISSIGAGAGCRLEVTLAPLSGTTHATIMLAAGCPFR
jgi:hypothetical protein